MHWPLVNSFCKSLGFMRVPMHRLFNSAMDLIRYEQTSKSVELNVDIESVALKDTYELLLEYRRVFQ